MGDLKTNTLCSPLKCLSNNTLFWNTDNVAASKIVASGSSKPELQTKAVKKKCFSHLRMKIINPKIPCNRPESNREIDRV